MDLLLGIVGICVVLWLFGFALNVGGGLIHILLVIAVIVFLVRLIRGTV